MIRLLPGHLEWRVDVQLSLSRTLCTALAHRHWIPLHLTQNGRSFEPNVDRGWSRSRGVRQWRQAGGAVIGCVAFCVCARVVVV